MKLSQKLRGLFTTLGMVMACAGNVHASEKPDFQHLFETHGVQGTFVLFDPQRKTWLYHDKQRANTPYLPASTFKIPNSLIALETEVASGPDFSLGWNSDVNPRQPFWPDSWTRTNTLHTALQQSVVWYYQEIARRIGPKRMQLYVNQFDYGNRDISGGIDQFWLEGGLRISAYEQIGFLERFYFGKLGASEKNTRAVKNMLVLEEHPQYRFSGKTGWAGLGETGQPQIGWLVGYIERGKDVYFYAMNIDIKKNEDAAKRLAITKEVLRSMKLM